MPKLLKILKWAITLGNKPQTFLGAAWIPPFLRRVRQEKKRLWALRILSLSPHYFFNEDDPKYRHMSYDEFLEAAFQGAVESRQIIFDDILKEYFGKNDAVLDYGCGPGFLARIVAENVRKVFACDISTGALECAQILNPSKDLEYIVADEVGLSVIEDGSLDVIYSFAMIQHITDDIFEMVLQNCHRMLKPGGTLLLHIQLMDNSWRTEDEWKSDTSLKGRIKFRYGLHCFARTEEKHRDLVSKHGFVQIEIKPVADLVRKDFDDIWSQSLLIAKKAY